MELRVNCDQQYGQLSQVLPQVQPPQPIQSPYQECIAALDASL